MISIEARYFGLNKILLHTVGLWPYQRTKFVQFRLIFFQTFIITAVLFQFTAFLTSKCTLDLIIKILSATFFYFIIVIKYISFAFHMEAVKNLLTQLQHIYDKLQDEYENAIMEKYGYIGKRLTIALIIFGVCGVLAPIAAEFLLNTSDVLPINVSQARQMHFATEYFVHEERYFSLILLHLNAAFCIGLFILIASGAILLAYLQLTCGMFRISSYRIERAMRINMTKKINLNNEKVIFEGIICAIDMHRQAMKLSELLISTFDTTLLCLVVVVVISLSLNLFQIQCSMVCDALIYTKNDTFLLQRGTKNFNLNLKGLFIGSFECFAMLVKASVSYFAVIYSTQ